MVGDAGCRLNPITAQGIAGAFRDAELLSTALDNGFSGRENPLDSLAAYERQRNQAAMPVYEFAAERSRLRPLTATEHDFYGRLAQQPQEVSRYLGALAGVTEPSAFFLPGSSNFS